MINRQSLIQAAVVVILFNIGMQWFSNKGGSVERPVIAPMSAEVLGVPKKIQAVPDRARYVQVKTDKHLFFLDKIGGRIAQADLLEYKKEQQGDQSMSVLLTKDGDVLDARSGISGDAGLAFSTLLDQYVLEDSQESIKVRMTAVDDQGVRYFKNFTFKRGDHVATVETTVENQSKQLWEGRSYVSIGGDKTVDAEDKLPQPKDYSPGTEAKKKGWLPTLNTYTGVAYHTPKKPYNKLPFDKMAKSPVSHKVKGGWIALQKRYFVTAWVPDAANQYLLKSFWQDGDTEKDGDYFEQRFSIQMAGPKLSLKPGEVASTKASLYAGPEITELLKPVAPGLELTVDYGFFWMIANTIFWLLSKVHAACGSWGLSLVLTTVLIRLLFYKPSEKSFLATESQKKLQPMIKAIEKRYEGKTFDREKSEEIVALYKRHGVGSAMGGGCLMTLLQLPVMFAFYAMINETVQLRHESFLWLPDLSASDPFFILPVITAAVLFFQTRMAVVDPKMQSSMALMPVVLLVVSSQMASGLALYMFSNFSLGCLQQYVFKRSFNKKKK